MVLCKVNWQDENYDLHEEHILCGSIGYKDTIELLDRYYGLKDIIDLYIYPLEDLPIQLTKETFNKLIHEEGAI